MKDAVKMVFGLVLSFSIVAVSVGAATCDTCYTIGGGILAAISTYIIWR
jgi:hypothetical protein